MEDLVTALLGAWLIAGLFVDGWAHNTQPGLETFFTPWHALFYSGFGAVAAWMGWSVWRRRPAAGSWRAAVPAGYGLGLAGTALFLLSGIGDLIVTTPLRSAWADPALGRRAGLGRLLPAVLSVTLAGCLTAFMFQYLHPVDENVVSIGRAQSLQQDFTMFQFPFVWRLAVQGGITGFVLSTALLFGPLLFLLRRWRPPAGCAAITLGVQCVLSSPSAWSCSRPPCRSGPRGARPEDRLH